MGSCFSPLVGKYSCDIIREGGPRTMTGTGAESAFLARSLVSMSLYRHCLFSGAGVAESHMKMSRE